MVVNYLHFFSNFFGKKSFVLHSIMRKKAINEKVVLQSFLRNNRLMFRKAFQIIGLTLLFGVWVVESYALTDKFRVMWRENPANPYSLLLSGRQSSLRWSMKRCGRTAFICTATISEKCRKMMTALR